MAIKNTLRTGAVKVREEVYKKQIDTRLVCGFEDAGKTSYIQDCIMNDRFYKRGSTLILCFERGESAYDEAFLAERNAAVEYYCGGDIGSFCKNSIKEHQPDRIYVEMNASVPDLREQLPGCMRVSFVITIIDWATFQIHYVTSLQAMRQMVSQSDQVTFRGCPSGRMLEPYSQAFRVMNPKASYLRQDPMGYHEKAFGLFLPFSLENDEIVISEKNYLPFWLDSFDHPEHYDGKTLHFSDPMEIRRDDGGLWSFGRVVMTCCMADLQFMSVGLRSESGSDDIDEGWAVIDALAEIVTDSYGQNKIGLITKAVHHVQAPETPIMDSRRR